tara:strand:- start:714 stop:1373 length:660 start_codon:yes stop_codon:yes gene_type:complete
MVITKRKLAEQALRIIQGGAIRDDAEIDIREVMMNIEQERDKLVRQELFQLLQMGENYISGSFVTSYNVSVETDNVKDMYFSKIPVTPLSLPNDMGVVQVSFIQDQYNPFIRMNTGQLGLYHGMPSESALGKVGFFIENSLEFSQESAQGTKIFYNKGMKKKDCNKEILVKVVTVSEDIAPDDIFPVSPEMQAVIVRNVVELYSVMRNAIADEQNDNIE